MVNENDTGGNGNGNGGSSNPLNQNNAQNLQMNNAIQQVSIRVPPFWKPDPLLWFCQLEAQFAIKGITVDATKFNTVVAHIESDILSTVGDIIRAPPAQNKYDTLKDRLINCHSESKESRLKKLFDKCYLGDRRPSELYRQMQSLAGTDSGTLLLKSLWLQKLPQQIQIILSSIDDEETTIDKLVTVADRCSENVYYDQVNVLSENKGKTVNDHSEITELKVQISELCKKVEQLSSNNSRSRNRSNSRSKESFQPRSSRSGTPQSERKCWYHRRFAEKATKCVSPCCFNQSMTKND